MQYISPKKRTSNNFVYAIFIVIISTIVISSNADAQVSTSPIWGNGNASRSVIGEPLHNDPNWGVTPSDQLLNSDTNLIGYRRNPNANGVYRDAMGNPIMRDAQGNIVYDNYGNPAIDSAMLLQQSGAPDNMGTNAGPVIPPDDPIDVPIDGGVGILLMIAAGIGYKNSGKKKLNVCFA